MKDGRKQSQRMIKFENDALSSPRGYFPSRSSKRGDFARTMIIARELSAQTNISEQADYTQRISVIGYRRSGYFVVFFVQIYAPNKGQKGETTAGAVALAFSFSRSSLSLSLSLSRSFFLHLPYRSFHRDVFSTVCLYRGFSGSLFASKIFSA